MRTTVGACLRSARLPALKALALAAALAACSLAASPQITAVRFWSLGEVTRVAIQTDSEAQYHAERIDSPDRIFLDLADVRRQPGTRGLQVIPVNDRLVKQIRIALAQPGVIRVVLDLTSRADYSISQLTNPDRIMIELRMAGHGPAAPPERSVTGSHVIAEPEPETPKVQLAPLPPIKISPPSAFENLSPRRAEPPKTVLAASTEPRASASGGATAGHSTSRADALPATQLPEPASAAIAAGGRVRLADALAAAEPHASASGPTAAGHSTSRADALPSTEPRASASGGPAAGRSTSRTDSLPATEPRASASAAAGTELRDPASADIAAGRRVRLAEAVPAAKAEPEVLASVARPQPAPAGTPEETALAAKRDSHGDRSLIRALGLKLDRVVIDPGHGGHDTGTIGPSGLMEKELVLDVAHRLGALIVQRLASEVVYTRSDDTFIPLEERTRIANDKKADLFLSIHANSSQLPRIAGSETFYLNFTTSEDALEVAARENATSQTSIHDLQTLVQRIALNEKVQESRELANILQRAMYSSLPRNRSFKNRGIKKAPFVVLIGAQMPSVLAEIAFLSNPKDESLLKKPEYRQKVAEALFRGVSQYADALSHLQVARQRLQAAPVQ
jgi:N-acetylmuramoyl-L-alanine amidase